MEVKEITAIIALIISVVSLLWTYFTSRKLEKYKAIIGLEKNYIESRLKEELNLIRELIEGLRNGRLLLEKVLVREKAVQVEILNKTLDQLEQSYTDALLFLESTHARVENASITIFTHELKNKIRNNLEKLSADSLNDRVGMKKEMLQKLSEIKEEESKLVGKLSEINNSLFDIYTNTLKNK